MTGNDEVVIKEMIELFLHQLFESRSDMVFLMKQKNWHELSRLAHKVKSSALVMGVEQMVNDMKELELLAREGKNVEKYPEYIERFNSTIVLAKAELSPYLND
jgi:HPt (histidine-containing phosphotransfer) domain-containing protein